MSTPKEAMKTREHTPGGGQPTGGTLASGDIPREFDEAAVRDMGGDKNVFASKACEACRALGSFMVLVVLGIVGVTYYATVVVVYLPVAREGGEDANLAKAALVIYHVLVFMLLWSYFATVLMNPGRCRRGGRPRQRMRRRRRGKRKCRTVRRGGGFVKSVRRGNRCGRITVRCVRDAC